MLEKIKRSRYKRAIAIFLIIFGIIAFITPGIPGAWFALIGLEILGWRILWIEGLKEKWKRFFSSEEKLRKEQQTTDKKLPRLDL